MKSKSFGRKLWLYFVLFTAIIFGVLWVLQTIFLQGFYNRMTMNRIRSAANSIILARNTDVIVEELNSLAYQNALLVFVTDLNGTVLYSGDEHTYHEQRQNHAYSEEINENPYHKGEELNWQKGAFRNLPEGYGDFLRRLNESDGTVSYLENDSDTFIYGARLTFDGTEAALYISKALGSVSGAISVLRVQLIWVTLFSLLLGFLIAYFIARKFASPIKSITSYAKRIGAAPGELVFENGFCREIDELADTLTQASDNLWKAENIRREFFANISHDLRTPLTMIKGYAEMVRDFSWEEEKSRENDLAVIIKESDRLSALVNEILDYSAIQSGGPELHKTKVNVSALAERTAAGFLPLCTKNGLQIDTEITENLFACCDENSITRVMYNFIDNALTHSASGQKIRVCVKRIDDTIRFSVQDFGEGIDKADLPYIWERYFTRKQQQRNKTGSGLGLAISKEILSAHNARFGVDSEAGKGSIFWFTLEANSSGN